LGTAPGSASSTRGGKRGGGGEERLPAKLGISARPLQPEEARRLDVDGGLVLEDVNGTAAKAGLRTGDVVLMANGEPVTTVDELRNQVSSAKDGKVLLLIQRGEGRAFIALPTN
jgi:serine protease Do